MKRIARQIQRAKQDGQGWVWFDNALKRGYFLYLTDVPGLPGFEPLGEVKPVLIDALKSINPPDRDDADQGRFRPYGGSRNWVGKAEDTGEEDSNQWEMIAVSQRPTDFVEVEVECVVVGVNTEYKSPYWRGQTYHGLLMRHRSREDFIDFALGFPDRYILTKSAKSESQLGVK